MAMQIFGKVIGIFKAKTKSPSDIDPVVMLTTVERQGYPIENGEYEIRFAPHYMRTYKASMRDLMMSVQGDRQPMYVRDRLFKQDAWIKLQ